MTFTPADLPGALILAQRPQIGPLVLNCTLREVHGAEYDMTTMPVEDGSVSTDSRIRRPTEVEIVGVMAPRSDILADSYSPVSLIGLRQDPLNTPTTDDLSPDAMWARLRAYADDGTPSQVITALEVYDDMLPVGFSHEENGGDSIIFTMRLRQIQIARTRGVQYIASDMQNRAQGEDDLGQQGSRELSDQELEQVTGFQEIVEVPA